MYRRIRRAGIHFTIGIALVGLLSVGRTTAVAAPDELPELLPRVLEVALALSALPSHVRSGAEVWVLERGGYVQATEGDNGFSCLVRRSGAVPGRFEDSVLPICYDRVGSETLLPAVLEEVRRLEAGQSPAEVATAIEAAWRDGTFKPPGPGVAYMLSPVFCLNGRCGQYVPHTMFYVPYERGPGVGANEDLFDHVPSIQAPGTAAAMAVIPVGEPGRSRTLEDGRPLMEQVLELLDLTEVEPPARR